MGESIVDIIQFMRLGCIIGFIVMFFVILIIIMNQSEWTVLRQIGMVCFSLLLCGISVVFTFDKSFRNFDFMASKPVIYFYPEEEMNIDVTLSNPENIMCDYPEYGDGWSIIAKPSGDLKELNSNKNLYCLYYEANMDPVSVENEGFVVKSADTADFLDEKLKILGLNNKERNEFIIYWLPRLEVNEYNYIRFLSQDEINSCQELNIDPKPDSTIRIMMAYKGLDHPIMVKEQKLYPAERAGFTVVEWGGTEIK